MSDSLGQERFRISKPESAPAVGLETTFESSEAIQEKGTSDKEASEPVVNAATVTRPVIARPVVKDRLVQEIETIMESDLTDLFLKMSPQEQQVFKIKGEETIGKIKLLMNNAKKNADKIFSLIRDWLKMIPGVNRFFLEQEAKNKTDKILLLS